MYVSAPRETNDWGVGGVGGGDGGGVSRGQLRLVTPEVLAEHSNGSGCRLCWERWGWRWGRGGGRRTAEELPEVKGGHGKHEGRWQRRCSRLWKKRKVEMKTDVLMWLRPDGEVD